MLVEEENIPITVDFLKDHGFDIVEGNISIEAVGEFFKVIKYKDGKKAIVEEFKENNWDDWVVLFNSYYDELEFHDFKYQHQILNLYYCLTGKPLTEQIKS